MQDELEIAGQRGFDRGAAELAVALGGMGIADREERTGHCDRIIHSCAPADAPVVDVAAGIARWNRADEIGFRWREPHGAKMQPRRYLHACENVVPLAYGCVIDPHPRIIDG